MKNCLKKNLSALLACLLVLWCLSAGIADEVAEEPGIPDNISESDIIGVWELTSMIMEGMKINPIMAGIALQFEFCDDHTVHGNFAGTLGESGQAKETWSLDAEQAMVFVSGNPFLKVRCEDGTLFLLMDEEVTVEATGSLVFTKAEENS